MKLHTVFDDNFFENPDQIVEYANTLKYYKSKENNWPGGRTLNMWELNDDLYKFLTNKVLSYYFDLEKTHVTWTYSNIRFHKVEPGDWKLHNKQHTRIHKDDAFLAGVIYLNKKTNEETGTSIFDNEFKTMLKVSNYYNNAIFFEGGRQYHGATSVNNEEERLVINFFMDNIQYKYMD